MKKLIDYLNRTENALFAGLLVGGMASAVAFDLFLFLFVALFIVRLYVTADK